MSANVPNHAGQARARVYRVTERERRERWRICMLPRG